MPTSSAPLDTVPLASTRTLCRLAWPIIVSNISVPLLGLIATSIIGHLPDARYLAAVTIGVTLFNFLFWGFGFLRMGTTGMTSQAFGRRDNSHMRLLLAQSTLLAGAIGVLLVVLSPWLIPIGLQLLGNTPDIAALAHDYAMIRIWAAPAVLVNYVLLGWLLGRQHARQAMWITIANNLVSIIGMVLWVGYWDYRSSGAAWATLVADYITLAISAWLSYRQLRHMGGTLQLGSLIKLPSYLALLRVNGNLFIRTLCLLFAMSFFTAQGNRLGSTTLSANGVLMELVMLVSFAMEGFAQAAETLTGQAAGARRWDIFGATVRICARLALITALTASLFFWIGGPWLIGTLTNIADVRDMARYFLPWVAVLPIIAVWSYLFDGVFVGATDAKAMRDTLILSVIVYLACWWLTRGLGNHGLWASFMLFMMLRAGGLASIYVYRRQRQWADSSM